MSSSVYVKREKHILILGTGPTLGLDNATLTAEKEYSINVTDQQKKLFKFLL